MLMVAASTHARLKHCAVHMHAYTHFEARDSLPHGVCAEPPCGLVDTCADAAAGFLPLNCYPVEGPMGDLARLSFQLHGQLAEELGGAKVRSLQKWYHGAPYFLPPAHSPVKDMPTLYSHVRRILYCVLH
jgi:hypothetical protein